MQGRLWAVVALCRLASRIVCCVFHNIVAPPRRSLAREGSTRTATFAIERLQGKIESSDFLQISIALKRQTHLGCPKLEDWMEAEEVQPVGCLTALR